MLIAASAALNKTHDACSTFDVCALNHFESDLNARLVGLEEMLTKGESGTHKFANIAIPAEAASDAWVAAKEALEQAQMALKSAVVTAKEAKQAVRAWEPNLKKAQAVLQTAKANLARFCEGPLATDQELLEPMVVIPPVLEDAKHADQKMIASVADPDAAFVGGA